MKIVSTCSLEDWKEALAGIITYTQDQDMSMLADHLGSRLESDSTQKNLLNACICYICSANLDNLVNCWQKLYDNKNLNSSDCLQVGLFNKLSFFSN